MAKRLDRLIEKKDKIRGRLWTNPVGGHRNFATKAFYYTLRVIVITFSGIMENRIFTRAAALSFSSLLGLFPMLALMVLVSGFVLEKADSDLAVKNLNRVITFMTPQVGVYERITESEEPEAETGEAVGDTDETVDATGETIDPTAPSEIEEELEEPTAEKIERTTESLESIINNYIEGSRSGAVGIVGSIVLIMVVIQLFSAIEDTFNDIWGVNRGRGWVVRIGLYWTVLTLGAVLAFAGLALLAAQTLKWANWTSEQGEEIQAAFKVVTKVAPLLLFAGLLCLFYRFVPNTAVKWRAASIGALVTVVCILGNNALAFAYVTRATMDRSLYGALAILPVLTFGMYVFWFFILLGCRVTYAVQNSHSRADKIAWDQLSNASKESLMLALFGRICQRFKNCEPALSAQELSEDSLLPSHFINASLVRLGELGLATTIPPGESDSYQTFRYQPSRPLERILVADLKNKFETHGNQAERELIGEFEPMVARYHDRLREARHAAFGQLTIEDIIGWAYKSEPDEGDVAPKAIPQHSTIA